MKLSHCKSYKINHIMGVMLIIVINFYADLYVEKMRYKAVSCMSRSYRPTIPVSYIAQVLGFITARPRNEGSDVKDSDGLGECVDWLKAHGACLTADNNGEMQLDTKVCSTSPL